MRSIHRSGSIDRIKICGLIFILLITFLGCTQFEQGVFTPWPEAETLLRRESAWLGGDGAYTVNLGEGRILWLFGDSFIDSARWGSRRQSILVRNSIAIQNGPNPAAAEIEFYWRMQGSEPAAFFHKTGEAWFWPGGGIYLHNKLLIFLMDIRPEENDFGFDILQKTSHFIRANINL